MVSNKNINLTENLLYRINHFFLSALEVICSCTSLIITWLIVQLRIVFLDLCVCAYFIKFVKFISLKQSNILDALFCLSFLLWDSHNVYAGRLDGSHGSLSFLHFY
jgi:hypothetical protein